MDAYGNGSLGLSLTECEQQYNTCSSSSMLTRLLLTNFWSTTVVVPIEGWNSYCKLQIHHQNTQHVYPRTYLFLYKYKFKLLHFEDFVKACPFRRNVKLQNTQKIDLFLWPSTVTVNLILKLGLLFL